MKRIGDYSYSGAGTLSKRRAQALKVLRNNPASAWVEETQIPGLTMYDMYCNPRDLLEEVDDVGEPKYVELAKSDLEKELRCTSCLEVFETTQLNSHCLHRSCKKCVLELVKKNDVKKCCPQCRRTITSKRDFRNDEAFDRLICEIYPYNMREVEVFDKLQVINANYKRQVEEIKARASKKREEMRLKGELDLFPNSFNQSNKKPKDIINSSSNQINNNQTSTQEQSRSNSISQFKFVLTPLDDETTRNHKLSCPFLSVPSNATVKNIKSYLNIKFPNIRLQNFDFEISTFYQSKVYLFF